jgi:hypothetical protein
MPEAIAEAPAATESVPQSTGDLGWIDNYGLEDVLAPAETPLPDAANSAAVETPKQAVATDDPAKVEPAPAVATPATDPVTDKPVEAAAPGAEAKPEVKDDDPELTAEDNELVRTRPAAEQPALRDRLKKATFISQYKDPEVPATGTVEVLRKISPSSYERLEATIIDQRLAEPTAFLNEVFQRNPEAYGKLLADGYQADSGYFAKQMTGRDGYTAEQVKTAVDFYESNKGGVVNRPAGAAFSPDEIEEIRLYVGEEAAAKAEAQQKAPAVDTQPAQTKEPAKPEDAAQAKPPTKQPTSEEQKAIQVQRDEVWDKASGQIESYLETWADDPRNGLGLKVDTKERELAPEVADLKDEKRHVLFEGRGDLPDFRTGFAQWGKGRPDFEKALKTAIHFANLGEEENAIEAARAMLPFVEQYKQERMLAPIFKRIDARIAAATTRTNPKTENDAIIPGAVGARSPQPTSDVNRRIDDLLLSDAMSG